MWSVGIVWQAPRSTVLRLDLEEHSPQPPPPQQRSEGDGFQEEAANESNLDETPEGDLAASEPHLINPKRSPPARISSSNLSLFLVCLPVPPHHLPQTAEV